MSEKKKKEIHVDNLIIHAKHVEIADAEKVEINQAKHIERSNNRQEDHFPRRGPWESFWGWQPREEETEQETEQGNVESEHQS